MKKKLLIVIVLSLVVIISIVFRSRFDSTLNNRHANETLEKFKFNGTGKEIEVTGINITLKSEMITVGDGTITFTNNENSLKRITYYHYKLVLQEKINPGIVIPIYESSLEGAEGIKITNPIKIGRISEPRTKLKSNNINKDYNLFFEINYGEPAEQLSTEKIELYSVN